MTHWMGTLYVNVGPVSRVQPLGTHNVAMAFDKWAGSLGVATETPLMVRSISLPLPSK